MFDEFEKASCFVLEMSNQVEIVHKMIRIILCMLQQSIKS